MSNVLLLSIIGVPWAGAFIVWLIGDKRPFWQHRLAAVFSILSGICAVALMLTGAESAFISISMGPGFGDFTLDPDGLGIFLAVVASVVGSLAVLFSIDYMKGSAQLGRYYALVLFFIGAMAGLVMTTNLLLVFFFWEITALCSYALISFYNDDPKAVAGGMKALIMTQLGGIGLLLGALLTYAYLGSYDLNVFLEEYGSLPAGVLTVLAFGFLAAAAAKSAQFPFQTWLPDAMEAPTPISALIHAATMVNAGVYLLARFYPAFENVTYWKESVMWVGVLSAALAALTALVATDLKRVLAYSTVSQLGFMVYAVGVGGIYASQFHLFSHAVFKALLFLGAGAVIHSVGTRDMRRMGGLGNKMPFVRNVFIIGAAALAGIPILNGFWSKELIIEAGLLGGPGWMFTLMVVTAGITALYTFRCVWMVFYGDAFDTSHVHDAGKAMKVSLLILAVGTLTTWLLAGPFLQLLGSAIPEVHFDPPTTATILKTVIDAPATWLTLGVIGIGLMLWWFRRYLLIFTEILHDLALLAQNSFGFEAINRGLVHVVLEAADVLRGSQTGLLNWNILGILVALIVVLLLLGLGA